MRFPFPATGWGCMSIIRRRLAKFRLSVEQIFTFYGSHLFHLGANIDVKEEKNKVKVKEAPTRRTTHSQYRGHVIAVRRTTDALMHRPLSPCCPPSPHCAQRVSSDQSRTISTQPFLQVGEFDSSQLLKRAPALLLRIAPPDMY